MLGSLEESEQRVVSGGGREGTIAETKDSLNSDAVGGCKDGMEEDVDQDRMAGNPIDPLQALSAALAVPPDSKEQADLLATLRESLEAHPAPIPILCTTLVKTVSGAGDSLLKRWVLDLLHFAIARSTLSQDVRTQR